MRKRCRTPGSVERGLRLRHRQRALRVWWVAYSHRGREYRESTRATGSKGETLASNLLKKGLSEIGRGRLMGPNEERVAVEDLATDL